MKKLSLATLFFLLFAQVASAAVTVSSGPTSLVVDPKLAKASSAPMALFSFTASQDAGETLSSVAVTINNNGTSTAAGTDIASLSVYKDNGDGNFDPATDLVAGTQTTVNVGSQTVISTASNNTLTGGKFFVALSTGASWSSSTAPADSITATLANNGITTSANSPVVTAVTTGTITADTVAPTLVSVVAKNTGGTSAVEAGDTLEITFSEPTNKYALTAANIASNLTLNNSHSLLDGAAALGTVNWNVAGTVLTITLSAGTSVPTVQPGDTVTLAGSNFTDLAGNTATGNAVITGSFTAASTPSTGGDDEDNNGSVCGNSLINGRLYKIGTDATVYLAAACRLKPFRGAAVFKARGQKFQNIITLSSQPANVTVSTQPVLPAAGTLVKGSDKTVWFVDSHNKRRGFTSAAVFSGLGFKFNQVQTISDSDLNTISAAADIDSDSTHPDGALIKCGNSSSVFEVNGAEKFPFASADAFQSKGHAFAHILQVDCGKFKYVTGAAVTK